VAVISIAFFVVLVVFSVFVALLIRAQRLESRDEHDR
jgi:hypothetical protein